VLTRCLPSSFYYALLNKTLTFARAKLIVYIGPIDSQLAIRFCYIGCKGMIISFEQLSLRGKNISICINRFFFLFS